jgi:hypothetical protein
MVEAEEPTTRRGGFDEVAGAVVHCHPLHFLCARSQQRLVDVELGCFGDAPGHHALAAHPVAETRLTFNDQHACALLRHYCAETGAGQAATRNYQVVVHPFPFLTG